ncbi:MAG: hypothetical protein WBB77_07370, partial [Candidatus Nanopelagicales bacterium]
AQQWLPNTVRRAVGQRAELRAFAWVAGVDRGNWIDATESRAPVAGLDRLRIAMMETRHGDRPHLWRPDEQGRKG